jgi:hypothetical protein
METLVPAGESDALRTNAGAGKARVRICYFNKWADGLEEAGAYVARAPAIDVARLVANPRDAALRQKARLDCDWYGENARCFAALAHPQFEFLPAWVCGRAGILDLAKRPREEGEQRWLVTMAHQPQILGDTVGAVFALLAKMGVRHLFYAFDEASRFMPCFPAIAPHLDVLIHDELPLEPSAQGALKSTCLTLHRSWVANFLPFAAPFNESPEEKIFFLGSQLGLSDHRKRQIAFLKQRFKDRFVVSHDHSISVVERLTLNRFKVGLAPEGRKFTTPAMSRTHTDRPFWCGCLGMVPVSENSIQGARLEELAAANLLVRYPHGDLKALGGACDRALAVPIEDRRRIYDHYNRHETVGAVVADALAKAAI